MGSDSYTWPEIVAAHLALVVALLHLGLGVLNWIRWASVGFLLPRDLRWPLFVVTALALLVALAYVAAGGRRRPAYGVGIVLSLGYVVGYFAWHASGHRPTLLVGPGSTHTGPIVPFVLTHLFAGPVEFLAIATELALAGVLGYLLVTDQRT